MLGFPAVQIRHKFGYLPAEKSIIIDSMEKRLKKASFEYLYCSLEDAILKINNCSQVFEMKVVSGAYVLKRN